ncbi:uncharacterized protein LOC133183417 [Saccostrea echinata]|uniref:uncharacterized protein LOC133183417 n=1 Tax=Saccostrea echinata TaxID=191078 RepID=UPI002A83BAE4|nr:uncharacterized protein LOC133183417 [Saccostrea echinata]
MAGGFSICVSVLWLVYVLSTHYFYYEKLRSKFFGLDGILRKPYDGSLTSDSTYFSYIQVYPVHGENQTDHAPSSHSNQNRGFNISSNRQQNNDRQSRPIAQCTEICSLNNQHVLLCNRQHIPRQFLNLPPDVQPLPQQSRQVVPVQTDPTLQSSDISVYPVENQTDHAPSSHSNQNREFNTSSNRQQNNDRPSRPIAQCTEICSLNNQHVLVCNRQHIPRQLLNLPPDVQRPRLSRQVVPVQTDPTLQSSDVAGSQIGEFLTIMVYTMTEDFCLRSLLGTSTRIVYRTLYRIFQLYHEGNYEAAIREWVGHLGASLENGQDEGHMVLPAFDFSSVVHRHCDNPNCSSSNESFNHVNVVLGRIRNLGNGRMNTLQCFIDQWFHTTERCNVPILSYNPEESDFRGMRSVVYYTLGLKFE